MQLLERRVRIEGMDTRVHVHLLTDVHYESGTCDYEKFHQDIRDIRDGNSRKKEVHLWIGGGDFCNGITAKDKRFDATVLREKYKKDLGARLHQSVARDLGNILKPISEYCIGFGRGNHEDGVIRYTDYDPAQDVAERLNVPYLGYSATIRLSITTPARGAMPVIIYWHHGTGASRSKGGKLNMLYNFRDKMSNADVFLTGHVHEMVAFPATRFEVSKKGKMALIAQPQLFINGGCYQKSYTTAQVQDGEGYMVDHDVEVDYAEKAGYSPSVIGHLGFSVKLTCNQRGSGRRTWKKQLRIEDYR